VEKYRTVQQATDANIMQSMRFSCWVTKLTDTHSVYVILIAFPLQQWLHERTLILRYTYTACLVRFTSPCYFSLQAYLLAYQFLSKDGTECVLIKIMLGTFFEPEHQQH
jgi:hypothetical protein